MPKNEKIEYRKIFIFLFVSMGFLFIYAVISGVFSVVYDDNYTLFGLPFALDSFLMGLMLIAIIIIVFLFFPKLKKAKEL